MTTGFSPPCMTVVHARTSLYAIWFFSRAVLVGPEAPAQTLRSAYQTHDIDLLHVVRSGCVSA